MTSSEIMTRPAARAQAGTKLTVAALTFIAKAQCAGSRVRLSNRNAYPRGDVPASVPLPIETERLLVRSFLPEADLEPMLDVYGDPEVMRHIPGGALSADAVRVALERYA